MHICTHKHIPEVAPEVETTMELLISNKNPDKKIKVFCSGLGLGKEKVRMLTNRLF